MGSVVAGELSLEQAQQDPDWHVTSNWLGFESYRAAYCRVPVGPAISTDRAEVDLKGCIIRADYSIAE